MYYKIKKVRLLKDGTIKLTAAASNVSPITYETSIFNGTMGDFLMYLRDRDFQLNSNAQNQPYIKILRAIDYIVDNSLDKNGLTREVAYTYNISQRHKAIKLICDSYAERLLKADFSDGKGFGQALGDKVADILFEGLDALKKRIADDKEMGIVRVTCAAYSIFEDKNGEAYDLLMPYESNEFILAPKEDYNNAGILQTDPSKIVYLGEGSGNYYAFLSGSGVALDREYYKARKSPVEVDKMFGDIDSYVKKAINAGLRLINGKTPYKGYKTA